MMPRKSKENITPELAATWMEQIFGTVLLSFDTIAAKRYRLWNGGSERELLGSWALCYDKRDLYLQSDLPSDDLRYFNHQIRELLNKFIQDRKKQDKRLKFPSVDEVMRKGASLSFDAKALRRLAERGVRPSSSDVSRINEIADLIVTREKGWMDLRKDVPQAANNLVYGTRNVFDSISFRFRETSSYEDGNFILYMKLPVYNEYDFYKRFEKLWGGGRPEDYWVKQTKQNGMEGLFKYNSYHVGTHASIDEERFQLTALTLPEVVTKLKKLQEPSQPPDKPSPLEVTRDMMLKMLFCMSAKAVVGKPDMVPVSRRIKEECKENGIDLSGGHGQKALVSWAELNRSGKQFKDEGGNELYIRTFYCSIFSDGQLAERDLYDAVKFLKEEGPLIASPDQVEALKSKMLSRMPLLKRAFETAAP